MRLVLEAFTVPPFQENTYLLGDADTGDALVVDPGGRADDIVRVARSRELAIRVVVATHAHIDHVSGVEELRELTGAPFMLHADAEEHLGSLSEQARLFGLPPLEPPRVDGHLREEEALAVGGVALEVRPTPGHAPGHVTLVSDPVPFEDGTRVLAFCGDVVFLGSIGRTDLPGGDFDELMQSIERQIMTLPDDTVLLSGHGPATTVGHERRHNPFAGEWQGAGATDTRLE